MDVSVLKAAHAGTAHASAASVLTVAAHAGDALRGGLDFTSSVYSLLEPQWRAQGVPLDDVAVAAEAEAEAEAVKVRLSSEGSTEGTVRGVAVPLSRADAEACMWPHVERLLDLCREALQEARVRIKDVRTVLLVGGQSRAPLVRRSVHRMFQRDAMHPPAPDEAVACGAAVHAALLGGGGALVTRDATAFALGLEGIGGTFLPVLPRGSPLPSVADVQVTTAMDAQGFLRVRVLQGNSPKPAENKLLGACTLFPLAPMPGGAPRVQVRFALDAQGFLQVSATDVASGAVAHVAASAPPALSEEDMLRLLREAQAAKRAEAEQEASAKVRAEAEAVVKYVEESLSSLSDRMPPDEGTAQILHSLRFVSFRLFFSFFFFLYLQQTYTSKLKYNNDSGGAVLACGIHATRLGGGAQCGGGGLGPERTPQSAQERPPAPAPRHRFLSGATSRCMGHAK